MLRIFVDILVTPVIGEIVKKRRNCFMATHNSKQLTNCAFHKLKMLLNPQFTKQ